MGSFLHFWMNPNGQKIWRKFGAGLEYYLPAFTQNGRHENWWKPEPSQSKDSNAAMPSRSKIYVSPKVVSPLLVEIEHPRKNCGSENGM
jgi:hypothetical protein